MLGYLHVPEVDICELKGKELLLPGKNAKRRAVLLKWHSTVLSSQRGGEVTW